MSYPAELYIHDLDRKVFAALNTFPRLIKLKEAYIANYDEKAAKISFMSSAIRLSERQMPEIYKLLPPICEKLGIMVPELYYVKSEEVNAATGGSTHPYIFVTSKLIEKLPEKLIASALAHECGHIACGHYLYHSIAMQLFEGIEKSPLMSIPGVGRFLTPSLAKALLFWDRCSELSADRASVLCDGNAETTIDTLLRVHGYSEDINRDEFIRQALDLKEFVNSSDANKVIEAMLTQWDTHPRLATRAYECYEWSKSEQYQGLLAGNITETDLKNREHDVTEEEIVAADVSVQASPDVTQVIDIDAELARVNKELKRYTNEADKADYAFAVFSGILSGAIDAIFVGETRITGKDIGLSHQQVNNFIQEYAKSRGFDRERLKDAISDLEQAFKVTQDNVWKGAGIGVSAKNHHLADLAHHPTPVGLVAAIVVQFLRLGSFVNKNGEGHFILVETTPGDVIQVLAPAVITGVLNWIVAVAEKRYEEISGEEVPKALHRLSHLVASTPIIVEIAKCADNWFGHLVSDMGGSKNTAGGGMGIPGIFVSLLYEVAALPVLKDTGLPAFVNDLYENHKMDLRHEMVLYRSLGKQAIPVLFNEIYVRLGFFITHLCCEVERHGIKGIDWSNVIPFRNRTVERMLTVSSMTFTVADTADAAVHAALESAGNWVLFAGHFVARFNYIGAGRAAIAIVREISNEHKEAQLIREKLILTEVKTSFMIRQLEQYKAGLMERVSEYLAQDIEAFIEGFDYMKEGIASGNSDQVIKGTVIIQRVLGREPQFTNQEEFDDLMDSDIALQL